MTLSRQFNLNPICVLVLFSDGEMTEGSVWEAALFSAHYKLSNLTAIVDKNPLQISDTTDVLMKTKP
ncbi:transketolase [Candidatus Bartonella washoeensis]|uniref:Transketolase N-terminal domain-containing protein n=1 Tax=Candidatus Bartonella washoeensis Sb944nv TaxID=1094563 RepID=J1JAQ6_9HYPH|nr:hypothetical protein MCQ_00130 [Bartonella washoeensis Sb944nv]SPU27376.1 transketolase [Bartonella washoeensis]